MRSIRSFWGEDLWYCIVSGFMFVIEHTTLHISNENGMYVEESVVLTRSSV